MVGGNPINREAGLGRLAIGWKLRGERLGGVKTRDRERIWGVLPAFVNPGQARETHRTLAQKPNRDGQTGLCATVGQSDPCTHAKATTTERRDTNRRGLSQLVAKIGQGSEHCPPSVPAMQEGLRGP
jgi:hypothetical protein